MKACQIKCMFQNFYYDLKCDKELNILGNCAKDA